MAITGHTVIHDSESDLDRAWYYIFDGDSSVVVGQFSEITEEAAKVEAAKLGFTGPFKTQVEALMAGVTMLEELYKGEKETHGKSKFIN